jgi:hypothetical protein
LLAVAAAVVVVAAAVTVIPGLDGEFLNWDDDRFVVDNPHVSGLSAENLAWAFGGVRFEAYQPLHMVSYMVDGSLWPQRPVLYRVHSLALYLLSLVLLLLLLRRLGFETVGAALGTLVFALAPFHTESVAWISGRKDVLALLFVLIAWHLHLSASGSGRRRLLFAAGAVLSFAVALLSKSAAMVAPAMIVAADVGLRGIRWPRALLSAAPCLLLAVAAGIAVVFFWSSSELIRPAVAEGAGGRIALVGWTVAHYLKTLVWPYRLSPLYADPDPQGLVIGAVAGFVALVVAVALLVIGWRRRWSIRGPAVAAAWFVLGIAPFLNLVPLYYLVADRYLLFPSLAIALVAALVANAVLRLKRVDRRVLGGAGLLLLAAAFGMARVDECRAWRDSESLWTHAVEREPDAFFARLKLGETLREGGAPDRAADQYREARRIRPGSRLALTGLFWSELLAQAPGSSLSLGQVEGLVLRFAGSLDRRAELKRLEVLLRARGLDRAAAVVASRFSPVGDDRRASRKDE